MKAKAPLLSKITAKVIKTRKSGRTKRKGRKKEWEKKKGKAKENFAKKKASSRNSTEIGTNSNRSAL